MEGNTIAEMRHEVIEDTIRIEEMLDGIIKIELGFEEEWDEKEGLINSREIEEFKKYILKRFNLPSKFSYIGDIIRRSKGEKTLPKGYGKDCQNIMEIRNTFAHTLAPTGTLYQKGSVGVLSSQYEFNSKNVNKEWENLYEQYLKSFNKVYNKIHNLFYMPINLNGFKE